MRSDMATMVADRTDAGRGRSTGPGRAARRFRGASDSTGVEAEVGPGPRGGDPTPGGALQQALLEQVGLVGVLDGVGLLADALGQGGEADRPAGEAAAQHVEDGPVDLVEAEFVDTEHLEPGHRGLRR